MSTAATPLAEKLTRPDARVPSSPASPEHEALLREIAEDARRESARYLDDSVVPEGGE